MPLFNMKFPANAGIFFGFIMNLASFNLLPTDQFYDSYFQMSHDDTGAVNENFDQLGFGSGFFLYNMGTLILGILSIPALMIVCLVLQVLGKVSNVISKLHLRLNKLLYWNHVLGVIFESYSVISMCALIDSKVVSISPHSP
jgi:hypothetical protein